MLLVFSHDKCAPSSCHASFCLCLLSPSPHIIGKPSSAFILSVVRLSHLYHSFLDHTQQFHQKTPISCMQEATPCTPSVAVVCAVCVWPGLQPHATCYPLTRGIGCLLFPTTSLGISHARVKTVFKSFPASFPADQGYFMYSRYLRWSVYMSGGEYQHLETRQSSW